MKNFKPKQVTLRAFSIENRDITKKNSDLFSMLPSRLDATKIKERRMLLNMNDPRKEEDFISYHNMNKNKILQGTIMRVMPGSDAIEIPDIFFERDKIVFSDLKELSTSKSVVIKDIQYFSLNENVLIMYWSGNRRIKSFQTYVNWLLEDIKESTIFEFNPKAKSVSSIQMKNLHRIEVGMGNVSSTLAHTKNESIAHIIKNIPKSIVKALLKDVKDLDETILDKLITARILIKFKKKPKEMTHEDYERTVGGFMKPIGDAEDVVFYPQKGKGAPIRGTDILKTKIIEIDTTSSGQLSERHLLQEMEMYLQEIQNE